MLELKRKVLYIVVIGSAGLLGTHLMDYLIARADSVIVVDNRFMGRKENVLHHLGNPNFEIIRLDLVHPLLLEVDQIYHLACPGLPVHYKSVDKSVHMFDQRNLTSGSVGAPVHKLDGNKWFLDKASIFRSVAEDGFLNIWDYEGFNVILWKVTERLLKKV
ncbi:hypothetical protein ZIOFF_068413 [Zingiber officinale]|uniref:NAD-dependent epimerase/dehydratase domain-containing protein n=1 Tax=Zingiber officinale TaxID=94328 RepID=A0A8J5CEQ0_ZINOF|nr:hypothetical protein ZIOFF_068413 [Zingiber officinale]